LRAELENLDRPYEVLIVDDVSTDRTADVVREHQAIFRELRLIRLPRRGGQTGCFEAAFRQVRGEYTIRMDADLQDMPADLRQFVQRFDEGADLVMGLRECRKHRRLYRLASMVYDLIILLLFDTPLHANSGSFVGFRTELIRDIPFRRNDHRYLPLIAIRRGAENIREVLVRHRQRQFGASKYQPLKKLFFGLPEIVRFLLRLNRGYYDLRPATRLPERVSTLLPS
jgi:glycosyltransferase involved in cell wall biosynthesis